MDQPISVAAGLIFRNGKLLITQRPKGSHLAGLWEFPGGKCEHGETLLECLQREIFEELGVAVNVRTCVETLKHDYPGKTVRLSFFLCELAVGEPEGKEGQSITWISPGQLRNYSFPEADAKLLQKLLDNEDWWTGK